jgi:hypothetical protein
MTGENVAWNAIDQGTKQVQSLQLPKFQVGGVWIGQNTDLGTAVPVVDKVKSLVGGVCTILQQMTGRWPAVR